MKIAILTLPLHANFGGIMQAYSLQNVLEQMGHEVVHIQHRRYQRTSGIRYMLRLTYRLFKIVFLRQTNLSLFYITKDNKEIEVIGENTIKFIDRYINIEYLYDFKDFKRFNFDCIVVGSDQIWRPCYYKKFGIQEAYLDFCREMNIRRFSYACSFGGDEWEYTPKETSDCRELIKLFTAVSVREIKGVSLCATYLGVTPTLVVDPTMLLSPAFYCRLIIKDYPIPKGSVMTYILDQSKDKQTILETISSRLNKIIYYSGNVNFDDNEASLENRVQPPLEQWLQSFRDCDYIVTDSFHACVFSILFHKPFSVLLNEKRGNSRILSLLEMFTLTDRLTNIDNVDKVLSARINWEIIDTILRQKKEESLKYLKNNLA